MRFRLPNYHAAPLCVLLGLLIALAACNREDSAYVTPSATFRTYKKALVAGDLDLLWSCLSTSYRNTVYKGDRAALTRAWQEHPEQFQTVLHQEITQEKPINNRIGYLLFDPTTLSSPQASPFFYFIREAEGWKITTHLDSLFHQELEQAIAKGEFKLPTD